jgi:hypothetical protein
MHTSGALRSLYVKNIRTSLSLTGKPQKDFYYNNNEINV